MTTNNDLRKILKKRFGFESFRSYQEEVCSAVVAGRDALLVMPTGAGKSLCYQLPGLARGGTTLVVSPLVALMEDQVGKLKSLGLNAERIHSGRERTDSRAACEEYLAGRLDYLFIAPERLAVAGFPEMLSRRELALVAIDEAHCISQWGHDFCPEYRMLGSRLPSLRGSGKPAPVLALTATATPTVQRDILTQLRLPDAETFIHGFRRTNIAVEVTELPPSARAAAILEKIGDEERRPAIVYSSTRKVAESLAQTFAVTHKVALYHGGLGKEERERTQKAFLEGKVDVMVATIAFGMGIDKANVRTVAHAALPSSLEAYYQEIGRAGRDGLPSKAHLFWSYADRRTHEFMHERNYPDAAVLDRIAAGAVRHGTIEKEKLREELRIEPVVFDEAVKKLWIHGGLRVDPDDKLHPGSVANWKESYARQVRHRLDAMNLVLAFAQGTRCRMLHLVRHFGDRRDSDRPCGLCDICDPKSAAGRAPDPAENGVLRGLLSLVEERGGQSLGRLHREGAPGLDRKLFDVYLEALAKAGMISIEEESFEKDGKTIAYRTAHSAGGDPEEIPSRVRLPEMREAPKSSRKHKVAEAAAPVTQGSEEEVAARTAALKEWRLAEARNRRAPAFTILSDRTLLAIAAAKPGDAASLQAVHGMGPKLVEKYGQRILEVLSQN
jgi:DNA topoisomerase-3